LIQAFSSILNERTLIGWGECKARTKGWMVLKNNKIISGQPYLKNSSAPPYPIAVIVGRKTGSSGEIGAALFKGIPRVRFFGSRTSGYLSNNQSVNLSKDTILNLTNMYFTTPDGVYRSKQYLDVDVTTNKPITEARAWISTA
jgi:C-terminal processing protease CtpA/Prc